MKKRKFYKNNKIKLTVKLTVWRGVGNTGQLVLELMRTLKSSQYKYLFLNLSQWILNDDIVTCFYQSSKVIASYSNYRKYPHLLLLRYNNRMSQIIFVRRHCDIIGMLSWRPPQRCFIWYQPGSQIYFLISRFHKLLERVFWFSGTLHDVDAYFEWEHIKFWFTTLTQTD